MSIWCKFVRCCRESTPIICSAKKLSNTKVSRAINSPVNRVIATNCPTGLRKRNAEWNHIYSPFWLNANRLEPNVESEKKKNFDDPIVGSERSNIDHGFESFNGKSSSGEEPTSPVSKISVAFKAYAKILLPKITSDCSHRSIKAIRT